MLGYTLEKTSYHWVASDATGKVVELVGSPSKRSDVARAVLESLGFTKEMLYELPEE